MEARSFYRLAARLVAIALAGAAGALLAVPEWPSARVPSAPPCVAPPMVLVRPNAGRRWKVDALLIVVRVATSEPADPSPGTMTATIHVDEDGRPRTYADV